MALADFRNSIVTQDKFSGTFSKFDRSVQSSARGLDKLGAAVTSGGVGMLFGATAGVAGAIALGKTVWSLGELGAQSLTTAASFNTLMDAVGQSPALLDRLKAASGGTATEMQLMQQANTALAGASGELATELAGALPKLIEAGRAAAQLNPSMGDAAFMTQSLITGIKRGSPMLIDNTGITLKLGEATEAYAASIGKSVSELTSQERSIAILRATLEGTDTLMEQVGGSLDSMTSDMQSAKVAVTELKTALGEAFAPAIASAANTTATAIRQMLGFLSTDEIEQLRFKINMLKEDAELGSPIASWRIANGELKRLEQRLGELVIAESQARMHAEKYNHVLIEYGTSAHSAATASATFSDRLAGLIATARGGGAAMQSLIGYINGVSAAANSVGSFRGFLGGIDVMSQSQYVAMTEQRIAYERALQVQVAANILTQAQADYQLATYDKRVNDYIGTLRDVTTATGELGNSYDDLKSKIGSALTPTFDLSGLTGGALGGLGGNSFDEAYKRLAAVALRPEELQIHAGDWAATFEQAGLTGLTPEDAQARAKELVEAYSKGLDFSLIDREAIKDSVRQAIRAEELYNSIVDEIYAEMGRPNPKASEAGYALGNQLNKGILRASREGGKAYNEELARNVSPYVARILAQDSARYNQ